jgi:hypothetical protein
VTTDLSQLDGLRGVKTRALRSVSDFRGE